jgi:hypothetical protein
MSADKDNRKSKVKDLSFFKNDAMHLNILKPHKKST